LQYRVGSSVRLKKMPSLTLESPSRRSRENEWSRPSFVAGIFRPPTLNAPTLGERPRDVAAPSNETPFPLMTATPRYPPLARDDGIVLVEARVDTGGGVADAKVIRSARPFDEPALDPARQWTFRPARLRGTSVATLAYIAFAFRQPVTVTPRSGSE
jgi:TonB family protein